MEQDHDDLSRKTFIVSQICLNIEYISGDILSDHYSALFATFDRAINKQQSLLLHKMRLIINCEYADRDQLASAV